MNTDLLGVSSNCDIGESSIHDQDENLLPENVSSYIYSYLLMDVMFESVTCQPTQINDEGIAADYKYPYPGCNKSYTRSNVLRSMKKQCMGLQLMNAPKISRAHWIVVYVHSIQRTPFPL